MKTILIVEDDLSLARALDDKLRNSGFKTIVGKDGFDGLESALKFHPDLILLDIIMPKVDGITFLKELREDEWGKNAKVIILSNLLSMDKITKDLKLKTNGVFVKLDVSLNEIVEDVNRTLNGN